MSERNYNPATLSVLLVDDHDPIRKSLRRVVESMGFQNIFECTGGIEAIKLLGKNPIDLIISDLFMRQGTGFELLEFVRNREVCADIPVLIVTGEASKEEIVKVADLGAEDYLLKPFQTNDFEKKVTRILNKYFAPSPLLQIQRRAERHFLESRYKEALRDYDQAMTLDAQSPRTSHGKALTLVKLNRTDEAISLLSASMERHYSYHRNYATLADILLRLNKVGEAIPLIKKELEINAKQPTRQTQLGMLLLKEGDALGAVDHFRIALQEDAKLISALMGMGQAYSFMSNVDKALYYFKRVRRYHPGATKALEAGVKVAIAANDPKRAEMFLKDEKATHPDQVDTYIILGLFFLRYDRDDEAVALAESMLDKDPDQPQAIKIMSMVHLKQKDYANAVIYLEKLAKTAPSPESILQLGEVYLHLQKVPEATSTLLRALSLKPDSPQVFFALGEAFKRSQQWIKSFLLYQKALKLGYNKESCSREMAVALGHHQKRRNPIKAAS